MPRLSIYTTVHNGVRHLDAALESLVQQSYRDFQLIVADRGSTDGTVQKAHAWGGRDPRIRVLDCCGDDEVTAFHHAIRCADTEVEYLAYHDSSHVSLPQKLELLVHYLDQQLQVAAVGCQARLIDSDGQDRGHLHVACDSAAIRKGFGQGNLMIHSATLMRRQVLVDVAGYRRAMRGVEPYDMYARMLLRGCELANLPQELHHFRLPLPRERQALALAQEVAGSYRAGRAATRGKGTIGLIFSKDRALQLEAGLRSVLTRCLDSSMLELKVLYTTSTEQHERQYDELVREYPQVTFLRECDFAAQVLVALETYRWVLFLVDDNLFVRDFLLAPALDILNHHEEALGISFRMGKNTSYSYAADLPLKVPFLTEIGAGLSSYEWTTADGDFRYSLEVSSSLYRVEDLLPLLRQAPFCNPNTLEEFLSLCAPRFAAARPTLLCYERSAAFCNPANQVQTAYANRASQDPGGSAAALAQRFDEGYRIDLKPLDQYLPRGCHEEVPLQFERCRAIRLQPSGGKFT